MRSLLFALLTAASVPVHAGPRTMVLINGGVSSDNIYSTFETELQSFQDQLKMNYQRIKILNSDGGLARFKGHQADGTFIRLPNGQPKLFPSQLRTDAAATVETVSKNMDLLSQTPGSELLTVVSDHGQPKGAVMWGGENMSAQSFQKIYLKNPNTTFRTIHSHCFAGATMLDHSDNMPNTAADFKAYMQKKYPKNYCGLATSDIDQLSFVNWNYKNGVPVTNDDGMPQLTWTKILAQPNLSLRKIFDQFPTYVHTQAASTPMLTTTYFSRDLKSFFCQKNKNTQALQVAPTQDVCLPASEVSQQTMILIKQLCDPSNNQNFAKIKDYENKLRELNMAHKALTRRLAMLELEKENPSVATLIKNYEALAVQRQELTLAKQPIPDKLTDSLTKILVQLAEFVEPHLQSKGFQQRVNKLSMEELFEAAKFKESTTNQYWQNIVFSNALRAKFGLRKSIKVGEVEGIVNRGLLGLQSEIAPLVTQRDKYDSQFTISLLEQPEFKELKALYERIDQCENAKIN